MPNFGKIEAKDNQGNWVPATLYSRVQHTWNGRHAEYVFDDHAKVHEGFEDVDWRYPPPLPVKKRYRMVLVSKGKDAHYEMQEI